MIANTKHIRRAGTAFALLAAMTGAALADFGAVTTSPLNIRSGPGTGYAVIGTLSEGTSVSLSRCQGSWCRLGTPLAGAWVSGKYLKRAGTSVTTQWRDPCDVDPTTAFHLRFGLYNTPLARYCRLQELRRHGSLDRHIPAKKK